MSDDGFTEASHLSIARTGFDTLLEGLQGGRVAYEMSQPIQAVSTDVLDLIDGAIEDYETSRDAMRWTPEPEAVQAAAVAYEYGPSSQRWLDTMDRVCGEVIDRAEQQQQLLRDNSDAAAPLFVSRAVERVIVDYCDVHGLPVPRMVVYSDLPAEIAHDPTENPRERALRLRHERHTGPATRRLDGRRR